MRMGHAAIFKALSPHYLFLFFARNGFTGWVALGGTLLCVTGSEALYADLGHFSRSAIRVSVCSLPPHYPLSKQGFSMNIVCSDILELDLRSFSVSISAVLSLQAPAGSCRSLAMLEHHWEVP